jgi:EAL domain-containing protein (putative c-di-GMP-specific phosphodiesterase class I)/GGDEF domain-containing protein
MTPAEGLPRPRALRRRLAARPMLPPLANSTLPAPRTAADDRAAAHREFVDHARAAEGDAWFAYTAAGDEVAWSDALATMLGEPAADGPPPSGGRSAGRLSRQALLRNVHRADHAKALQAATRAWTRQEDVRVTLRLVRADGSWFDVDCQLSAVAGPDGATRGVRGVVLDVSARERARREVARLARRVETVQPALAERDPGTGLLTRAGFADEVDRALRIGGALLVLRVEPEGRAEAPLRPELATELLNRAARVLENVIRPDDQLARVGPSEIGVLLTGGSWAMARRQADLFVEALRAHPFVLPEAWLRAQAWAGLIRFQPDAEAGSHDLLIDADHAWRQARDAGRPVTQVAHPVPARDRQGSYRSRVAEALGTDRFTLFAQPILELQTNRITRHELLLRVLEEGGPCSPVQVLDTAERLDAIFGIDLWVVERAMQLAGQHAELCLQVNLSGRSVGDPRLTTEVERMIERHGVNPDQITFEITETALIGNLSEARRFTDRVRDLGCQLALDDFGSGYASFRYLRLFPIDLVKIDGEYIVDLARNPQDQVLVRALVQVCQAYGIHTVAEFVEDEQTLQMLREFGVDFAQGYLIGHPAPVEGLLGGDAPSPARDRLRRPPAGA